LPTVDTEKLRNASASTMREYRTRRNLTQQTVSELAELSRSYISELEDGKHLPTIETLFRLSKPFEVQAYTLVKEISRRYDQDTE